MGRSFKRILRGFNKISDCQPMCPWCGSENAKPNFFNGRYNYICGICNQHFRAYTGWLTVFILIICTCIFLLSLYNKKEIPLYIIGIISFCLIGHAIFIYKMPYKRVKNSDYIPEEFLGFANITWLPHREGGLRLPNLTIWNHYILGVCFIDDEGKPISQTGYIRVNKMFLKKTRKIYRITDNFQYDKERMGRFAIFYKEKRVGTGIMLSKIQ